MHIWDLLLELIMMEKSIKMHPLGTETRKNKNLCWKKKSSSYLSQYHSILAPVSRIFKAWSWQLQSFTDALAKNKGIISCVLANVPNCMIPLPCAPNPPWKSRSAGGNLYHILSSASLGHHETSASSHAKSHHAVRVDGSSLSSLMYSSGYELLNDGIGII